MSCCKVDIKKEKKIGKPNYVKNFSVNILSIITSIVIISIAFPFLYLVCLYFIITGFVTETDNSVGKLARVIINTIKQFIKDPNGLNNEEYEQDINDAYNDFISNPEKYEIVGLEQNEEHKTKN